MYICRPKNNQQKIILSGARLHMFKKKIKYTTVKPIRNKKLEFQNLREVTFSHYFPQFTDSEKKTSSKNLVFCLFYFLVFLFLNEIDFQIIVFQGFVFYNICRYSSFQILGNHLFYLVNMLRIFKGADFLSGRILYSKNMYQSFLAVNPCIIFVCFAFLLYFIIDFRVPFATQEEKYMTNMTNAIPLRIRFRLQ